MKTMGGGSNKQRWLLADPELWLSSTPVQAYVGWGDVAADTVRFSPFHHSSLLNRRTFVSKQGLAMRPQQARHTRGNCWDTHIQWGNSPSTEEKRLVQLCVHDLIHRRLFSRLVAGAKFSGQVPDHDWRSVIPEILIEVREKKRNGRALDKWKSVRKRNDWGRLEKESKGKERSNVCVCSVPAFAVKLIAVVHCTSLVQLFLPG